MTRGHLLMCFIFGPVLVIESRKRTTVTRSPALRHMNENVNWTEENILLNRMIADRSDYSDGHTFPTHVQTILPTLKYQRGVNLTAYEINIRKAQAKIQKNIDAQQKVIDEYERKWKGIREEMNWIRKNISHVKKTILDSAKYKSIATRKKELTAELKRIKMKYNITSEPRDTFEFKYNQSKHTLVRMIKKNVQYLQNKTKYMYDFILRKNEMSDEVYDLEKNITHLDMLINEEIELEYIAPGVQIRDIIRNLSNTVKSINTKSYKYKKAKRGMKHIVSLLNKFLNASKTLDLEKKNALPLELRMLKTAIRNLTSNLQFKDERVMELEDLLKKKDEEYDDAKFMYYRKDLNIRETKLDHFVLEMNLTNFLKETVRKDLIEAYYTPEIDFLLRDESSIDVKDNLLVRMIEDNKYWLNHGRYNRTTTINYEWAEVLDLDQKCRKYIHDNWFSFEAFRDKYENKRKRRKRRHLRDRRG